jgi:5-methylthioadenosine/S-adenosylhomocysteine deaminase
MQDSFFVTASWVVPVRPGGVLHDAGICVRAGRIARVAGDGLPLPGEASLPRLHLDGHVLLPGLVNAHGHAAMTLFRGMADDIPLEQWLRDRIWPAEARFVDAAFTTDGTQLAMAEMLHSGTTCFSDMYFFPEAAAAAAAACGMRAQIAFPVARFVTRWARDEAECIHKGLALRDAFRDQPRLRFAFGPHAPYTVTRPTLERIATLSGELAMPVHIHLHETAGEVADGIAEYGCRPLEMLRRGGLVNEDLQAVHMTQASDADVATLAAGGAAVVHCPVSNVRTAAGYCPLGRLRAQGVRVGIGTDGAAANNSLDLFRETGAALLLARRDAGSADLLPAAEAIELATLGGARVLGIDAEIGSLEPGKWADMIAVDLAHPAHWPVHDPVSQLVHTAAGSRVRHAWVAGVHLLDGGRLTTLDEPALLARAAQWRTRMAAS